MTGNPLLEELAQAHAAYETAAMAAASARAAVAIADMRLLRAEHDAANVRAAIAAASISPPSAWQPIATAVAEVARLTAGIGALYKYIATKWPEADDVLDEIQALIAKREGNGP